MIEAESVAEILSHVGIGTAAQEVRLEFLNAFVRNLRELIRAGAHKPHVRRMLREAIFYQWERPQFSKYAPERNFSIAAWKYKDAPPAERRRLLRYDHAIPMRLVTEKLLEPRADVVTILKDKVHACIITKEEDSKLSKAGLRQSMPKEWMWETGAWNARYVEAKIKLRG